MISLTCGIRVEAPSGGTEDPLFEDGWNADQQWTPRQRDLTEPTEDPGVRIKVGAGAGARAHCRTMTGVRPSEAHRRAPLSDDQLVEILDAEHAAAATREGARLAVIRELDQRGHAHAAGATGTAAWLAHRLLIDPARAHHDVRAAQQLDPDADTPPPPGALTPALPGGTLCLAATGRALLAGDISRAPPHTTPRKPREPTNHTRP